MLATPNALPLSMHRQGRSTSVDFTGLGELPSAAAQFKSTMDRLTKRGKSISGPSGAVTPKFEGQLVWRERKVPLTGRWPAKRLTALVALLVTCVFVAISQGPSFSDILPFQSRKACNPYAVPGQLHADYSEPSNNYWAPNDQACTAPRFVRQLRNSELAGMRWMQNKTVLLIGDSIERDHVSLFCSVMGREHDIIKGKHPYKVGEDLMLSNERKKDRASRIAFKGMQESTLPRICYIEELNFVMTNLYHFGLDEQDYWQNIDQYHGAGSIEKRFTEQYLPFINKLRSDDRSTAPDLVEVGSGMFDLARWAQEDIAAGKSTEEDLSEERLKWYSSRVRSFMDATSAAFPDAIKLWRGVTIPEDQASELDYFRDTFKHASSEVAPHFSPNRVQQIDRIARKLVKPLHPTHAPAPSPLKVSAASSNATDASPNSPAVAPRSTGSVNFVYNAWSSLVKGVPAHQTDRLHGGDLATPGAVLWSDIILWHLKEKSAPLSA